jgi:hypothetical protein
LNHQALFESVPNFSEGRRHEVIAAIARAISPTHVLDVDADHDHHRVVISMAAQKSTLLEGVMAAVGAAVEHIDMRAHAGVHPRVGAADVVPFVPLGQSTLADARELAREAGERIWSELKVPVYFYGENRSLTLAAPASTPPRAPYPSALAWRWWRSTFCCRTQTSPPHGLSPARCANLRRACAASRPSSFSFREGVSSSR